MTMNLLKINSKYLLILLLGTALGNLSCSHGDLRMRDLPHTAELHKKEMRGMLQQAGVNHPEERWKTVDEEGYAEIVSQLSRERASLDKKNKKGQTLLHVAARQGELAVVYALIEAQVSLD